MINIFKSLLSDPNSVFFTLGSILGLIATVITALIGHYLWFRKIGKYWKLVAIGAVLVVLTAVGRFAVNFIMPQVGGIEDTIWMIYASNILYGLGNLLFLYGLYKYILDITTRAAGEADRKGPFIG